MGMGRSPDASGGDKISSGQSILALYEGLYIAGCPYSLPTSSEVEYENDLAFNYHKVFSLILDRIKLLEIHAQCYTWRSLGSIVYRISASLRSNSPDSDTTKNLL